MDLDLRKLRYFAAVADELHFGRAAERLHIAQPVLSRQIREFERELDVVLFTRTNKRVQLTDAGRQLLDDARPLLEFSHAAVRRVRRAHAAPRSLTIGFAAGVRIGSLVQALEARHPEVRIDLRQIPWPQQTDTLHDGTFDVSFIRRPFEESGLNVIAFATERRVVLLSRDHPLASKKRLSLAQLSEFPVVGHGASSSFSLADLRGRDGTRVLTMEEKLEHVASGRAIAFTPATVASTYVHPGIVAIPVAGLEPSEVCIAHRSDARSPLIAEIIALARELAPASPHESERVLAT